MAGKFLGIDLAAPRSTRFRSARSLAQPPILSWLGGTFANSSERYFWIPALSNAMGPFPAGTPALRMHGGRLWYQSESSRTNIVLRNEELNVNGLGVPWKDQGAVVVTADDGVNPAGEPTAEELALDAATNSGVTQDFDDTAFTPSITAAVSAFHREVTAGKKFRLRAIRLDGVNDVMEVVTTGPSWGRAQGQHLLSTGTTDPRILLVNELDGAGDILATWPQWEGLTSSFYFPSSPIPTTTAAVTRAADIMSYAAGAVPGELLSGKYQVRVMPYYADTALQNSENHYILYSTSSEYLRLRKSSGGVTQLELGTAGGNVVMSGFAWAAFTEMTFTVDFDTGTVTVAGADSGNGSNSGTVSNWATGNTLFIGSSATPNEHFDGAIAQPEYV